MKSWLNWREIERMNAWGVRSKLDEEAFWWDKGAQMWEERTRNEGDAGERQVELMDRITGDVTILDVGCGTGPLTIPAAKKAKTVYALDSSQGMLDILMEKAEKKGIKNIIPICGNWYSMTHGMDFPVCDIAFGRHAPFQNDIIGFCKSAKKYCYSLWNVAPLVDDRYHENEGVLADKRKNPYRTYNEPNGRLFGFNVHFNLLYDAGADPEIRYDKKVTDIEADSFEEILRRFFHTDDITRIPPPFVADLKKCTKLTDGRYRLHHAARVSILGWDPSKVRDCEIF